MEGQLIEAAVLYVNRGRIVALGKLQRVQQIAMDRNQIGPQRDSPPIAVDGSIEVARVFERGPEVIEGFRVKRLQFDGAAVTGDRLVELALLAKRGSQVTICLG